MGAVTTAIAAGTALYSAYTSYEAGQKQAEQEEELAKQQTEILKIRQKDAIRIGEEQAGAARRNLARLSGTQKANTAASGVVVGQGSSQEIALETELLGQEDINRIKSNAALEAWGYKKQSENLLTQANMNATAYRNKGTASLLSGVAQAGLSMYDKNSASESGVE